MLSDSPPTFQLPRASGRLLNAHPAIVSTELDDSDQERYLCIIVDNKP